MKSGFLKGQRLEREESRERDAPPSKEVEEARKAGPGAVFDVTAEQQQQQQQQEQEQKNLPPQKEFASKEEFEEEKRFRLAVQSQLKSDVEFAGVCSSYGSTVTTINVPKGTSDEACHRLGQDMQQLFPGRGFRIFKPL
jgi:hypothetical protein